MATPQGQRVGTDQGEISHQDGIFAMTGSFERSKEQMPDNLGFSRRNSFKSK
jgi:hypothetical protein